MFTNFFDQRINETLQTPKKNKKNRPSAKCNTPATIFCHTFSSFINNQHFSVATCFRGVLLCTVLERMSLFYTRYLENNQIFYIHVTFFWRYLIDKLRKSLLNCLLPFLQIFVALLKERKKFVSNTSVHIIQLFQLAVLYLIKWTNSLFKYSWTRQHKTTATLETNKVAALKRFKQESIYGMSAEKVAVIERWPL